MALSVFEDKAKKPQERRLWQELGRSSGAWQALTEWLAEQYDPVVEEWVYFAKEWGWSLRLKHKKRTVLYLTPCNKHFLVGFVLGERAVAAALEMRLPRGVAESIKTAKKYVEGRGIRLVVRYKKDLAAAKRLTEAKMAN